MSPETLQVLFRREEEPWNGFLRRIQETDGEVLVVLPAAEIGNFSRDQQSRSFLDALAQLRNRVRVATRHAGFGAAARGKGIRVFDHVKMLRQALAGHPQAEEALGIFSPRLWRQQWRSRLQSMGLLSLPKIRIGILIALSVGLFLFVVFRLLPSAEVRISPRGDVASQTTNFILVQSGAVALPSHVRAIPLVPIVVRVSRTLTFREIGKQFIGKSAQVPMTIINKNAEEVSLRKGTRLQNQAGMIFKLRDGVNVPPNGTMSVVAKADTVDAYDEIVGERGNVPAGVRWDFPALAQEERKTLYAENRVPAQGGVTAYRTVLQQSDLDIARRRLEQELLAEAKTQVEQRITVENAGGGQQLRLLGSDQLIKSAFTGFVMPVNLLNQPVAAVDIQGGLVYRALAYDAVPVLRIVSGELASHVSEGKRLLPETVDLKRLEMRVFDYADDLSWIKSTVELTATEQFVLDPLTPEGSRFAKKIREQVVGVPRQDAIRIIKNLPEVEKVSIRLWPPWNTALPTIPSHISIITHE